ncbi:MAG: glycosyl hydrolase family 28 protein [Monoglobaceae bacterium]
MVNVNDFNGLTDDEKIENAIKNRDSDGMVLIPPRCSDTDPERTWWSLDRAVLIPENTTIILRSCKIKLSDKCRDNFFRTANCGMGIAFPEKISNVHVKGEGLCVLEGADHPRATGDSSKILANPCPYTDADLCKYAYWVSEERKKAGKPSYKDKHTHSYGTDAGNPGESGYGDWRGIGILFANTDNFSIENIHIAYSHGWGISLEACTNGRIEKICFNTCMSKEIDGMLQNMENQDGIDIRNGCHNIIISDVTGRTGDDLIALTAIANEDEDFLPGGSLYTTHVMHNDWSKRDKDIHDILIRNVMGYSQLCYIIRLLPCNSRIWNVVIDGVVDTSPDDLEPFGGLLLGDLDNEYGINLPDSMRNISISNIVCNRPNAICIDGCLSDSVISNVTNRKNNCPAVIVSRENGLKNVKMSNLCAVGIEPFLENYR